MTGTTINCSNMATTTNTDRTRLVPSHQGPNVLPNSPFFSKLLRHARRNRVAVRDVNLGVEKTYGDVLADALALRMVLESTLDRRIVESLAKDEEVYIGVLAPGGYEFTVAMLAVLAIGAAAVPMSAYAIIV
jgi:malonyl-CoA/methylmalonyl-CoA synthetase